MISAARAAPGVPDRAAAARATLRLRQGHVHADAVLGSTAFAAATAGVHAAGQLPELHLAFLVSFVAHVGDSVQGCTRA